MPETATADAPGRVNLIGEHTDYHQGFVLPTVSPLRTRAIVSRRRERRVSAASTAPADNGTGAKRNDGGKDEALMVVGVLANEVDAATSLASTPTTIRASSFPPSFRFAPVPLSAGAVLAALTRRSRRRLTMARVRSGLTVGRTKP